MTRAVQQRVLVVEDDASLQQSYRTFFARHPSEFAAEVVCDGEQALDSLRRGRVDALLVDWGLPGISGFALVKAVRAQAKTRTIGVLMVTAKASPSDAVYALEAGADDYLSKPFDWNVLLARLRSLVRRSGWSAAGHALKRFDGLELDLDANRLRLKGRTVALTPKEMELLKVFAAKPDILHAQSYLWDCAWGYESDHWERTLIVTLSSLRRKLGPAWGPRLKAQKGRGYILETDSILR